MFTVLFTVLLYQHVVYAFHCSFGKRKFKVIRAHLLQPPQKRLWFRCFESDQDEIWQGCSSRKYAPTDKVGFSI